MENSSKNTHKEKQIGVNTTPIINSVSILDVMAIEREHCINHNLKVTNKSYVGYIEPVYEKSLFTDWHTVCTKNSRIKVSPILRNRYIEYHYQTIDTNGITDNIGITKVYDDGVVVLHDIKTKHNCLVRIDSSVKINWRLMWLPDGFMNEHLNTL